MSSLQEGGVSVPQPNGVQHAEIMRPSASIEPGPLLHEVDSLGRVRPVSNPAVDDHHQGPPYLDGGRPVRVEPVSLHQSAKYQKKKVWTDPRFRHVGSIGKFVPCFEEDGEPTLAGSD